MSSERAKKAWITRRANQAKKAIEGNKTVETKGIILTLENDEKIHLKLKVKKITLGKKILWNLPQ